ncbi:MAG: RNA methyltransferase [Saprospiraceae bacterium]
MANITDRRREKFARIANLRQFGWTVILENVHDRFNLAAVMRTCDAVGIHEIFVLQTEKTLHSKNILLGKKTSAGTRKWVDVHYYQEVGPCFEHVRRVADTIMATHLGAESVDLYDMDQTGRPALLFGNERDGLSPEALAAADGNFTIPMHGMAESLNISVACAVTLYEGRRQRAAAGLYENNTTRTTAREGELMVEYLRRNREGGDKKVWPKG